MIAVNVDASYHDGHQRAGIAYSGPAGWAAQVVPATNAMQAELMALAWAMAAVRDVESVTFRHDADLSRRGLLRGAGASPHAGIRAAREAIQRALAAHPGWHLKRVSREENHQANVLARRALKLEVGRPIVKAHCREAAAREERQRA